MLKPSPQLKRSFLHRRLLDPIRLQLQQGADPDGLAKTIAAGTTIAIVPVLGIATFLCLGVGVKFRLNQPILHAINYLMYPVQLALIPVFLESGAHLFGADPIIFKLSVFTAEFQADKAQFFEHYGRAALHAFVLWLIVAPFLGWIISKISFYFLSRWKEKH